MTYTQFMHFEQKLQQRYDNKSISPKPHSSLFQHKNDSTQSSPQHPNHIQNEHIKYLIYLEDSMVN